MSTTSRLLIDHDEFIQLGCFLLNTYHGLGPQVKIEVKLVGLEGL